MINGHSNRSLTDSIKFRMFKDVLFKPGACSQRPHAPGFLKLLWFACRYACVCVSVCLSVCVSTPEAINNQWRDIV